MSAVMIKLSHHDDNHLNMAVPRLLHHFLLLHHHVLHTGACFFSSGCGIKSLE